MDEGCMSWSLDVEDDSKWCCCMIVAVTGFGSKEDGLFSKLELMLDSMEACNCCNCM